MSKQYVSASAGKLAEQQAEQKRNNEIARKNYLASIEKKKIEAEKAREIIRAKEAENLKNQLKATYLNSNPTASVQDFERDFPSLKAELFKNNAIAALEKDKNLPEYQM